MSALPGEKEEVPLEEEEKKEDPSLVADDAYYVTSPSPPKKAKGKPTGKSAITDDAEYERTMVLNGSSIDKDAMMASLTAMGVDATAARIALDQTKWRSVDAALSYIYEGPKPTGGSDSRYGVPMDDDDYYGTAKVTHGVAPMDASGGGGVLSSEAEAFAVAMGASMSEWAEMSAAMPSLSQIVESVPIVMDEAMLMIEPIKMIMVVRSDLGMSPGKAAAQCCHAACHLTDSVWTEQSCNLLTCIADSYASEAAEMTTVQLYLLRERKQCMDVWNEVGAKKIVCKAKSLSDLLSLELKARSLGLNVSLITDAGHTELEPGTQTVLGIGPAPSAVIDRVTGELSLYR